MSVEAVTALSQHSVAQSLTTSPAASLNAAPNAPSSAHGPTFADALKSAAQQAYDTVSAGERAAQAGALGQASLHDVVHSVIQAELTVQAVTSIRDKTIQAYQELLRMPV